MNFWDFEAWGSLNVIGVLLVTLLIANGLKRSIGFLRKSLIPTSVLGGLMLLVIASVYKGMTGNVMFDEKFFGGNGMSFMEVLTYHALALGFIANTLKSSTKKMTKKRSVEVFNTGVTTVATYLLQAVLGLGITLIVSLLVKEFFAAAGVLLPFGFGQGTGQALNYGGIYETQGFEGGRAFGLTVAALGFLSASFGGVLHLSILRRKGKVRVVEEKDEILSGDEVQPRGEIPMNGGLDKLTVQLGFIIGTYVLTFLAMYGLSELVPSMQATIYGFNFLIGVLLATLVKAVLKLCRKIKIVRRQYLNNFLLDRISNFFFDLMVIAGIAAIQLDLMKGYWGVMAILAVAGLVSTYLYNYFIAKKFFKDYAEEQFLAMYGMLTGTASTGMILLREMDPEFKTPVADNLVYQNFPAIVFGFPLMLLANMAPAKPFITWGILVGFFAVMNIILFRAQILKRLQGKKKSEVD
jgi:ESS family glutamate:Na+ symporter